MSGVGMVLDALYDTITAGVATLPQPGPIMPSQIVVKEGWVGQQEIREILQTGGAVINIFDTGSQKDTTRWISSFNSSPAFFMPAVINETIAPNEVVLPASKTQVFTLGFAPGVTVTNPGDAVGFGMGAMAFNDFAGAVYTVQVGDTLTTIAANVAALINSNPAMSARVSAAAIGNQIVLTSTVAANQGSNATMSFTIPSGTILVVPSPFSILPAYVVTVALGAILIIQDYINILPVYINANVGGIGAYRKEVGRSNKLFQINVWAPSHEIREYISDYLDQYISQFRYAQGLLLADANYARLTFQKSILDDSLSERAIEGTYRRISYFWVEYPLDVQNPAYTVLITTLTKVICNSAGMIIFQEN